ncbi:hypothetical protein Tco_1123373 [Tanacetum coccineum]|uniref:Uncharacterized protein n=1 Tax=Tanacetum coccineum TaxID=301880 RepID=A0ABQ5J5Q5_9ASTR
MESDPLQFLIPDELPASVYDFLSGAMHSLRDNPAVGSRPTTFYGHVANRPPICSDGSPLEYYVFSLPRSLVLVGGFGSSEAQAPFGAVFAVNWRILLRSTLESSGISKIKKSIGRMNLSTFMSTFSMIPLRYWIDLSPSSKLIRVAFGSPSPTFSYIVYGIKLMLAPRSAKALSICNWPISQRIVKLPGSFSFDGSLFNNTDEHHSFIVIVQASSSLALFVSKPLRNLAYFGIWDRVSMKGRFCGAASGFLKTSSAELLLFSFLNLRGKGIGYEIQFDAAYPRDWIRRIGVSWSRDHGIDLLSFVVFGKCRHGYAVSSLMDTAYWSSE